MVITIIIQPPELKAAGSNPAGRTIIIAGTVSFRWLKGQPWVEGSVIYAEEYIHGKLHKLKFKITKSQ